jgi:hypothetical protein
MTPLAEALVAAQRHALATLEKAYVAGSLTDEELYEALNTCGITDQVDQSFLRASLDVLKEWGVTAPTMSERVARENGEPEKASDKQAALIATLCKRHNQPLPEVPGLTKAQASEIIDALDKGTYDPAKWTIPF